jgi:hypothetical protein
MNASADRRHFFLVTNELAVFGDDVLISDNSVMRLFVDGLF